MALITEAGVLPDDTPPVPLAEAPEGGAALRLAVPNDLDPATLAPRFDRIALIAVAFPKFADGRGFSLARRLRDLGYAGRLRAAGWLIPDQWAYARACGFDEAQIADDLLARHGHAAWAAATPRPPFLRRRAA